MSTNREQHYHDYYNKQSSYWASVYGSDDTHLSIYAVHFRQRREVILGMIRKMGLRPGARALDAGCGPGAYIQPLLDLGFDVSVTDQSEKMVEEAARNFDRARASRVTLRVGGLESLPFDDRSFDLVLNVAVLMYVSDPARAIEQLHRVTKPGGTLIITVDNRRDFADMVDIPMRIRRLWARLRGAKPRNETSPDNTNRNGGVVARVYSPRELKQLLAYAGFIVDEETSIGFGPLLCNGKRFLPDVADRVLDRALQFLRRIPGLRLTGYTYFCRCHRA